MSMVQVAIFGAVISIMAFTPFLGYIPLGFTPGDDHPRPGHYRFTADGTEKRSGTGIPFRAYQLY